MSLSLHYEGICLRKVSGVLPELRIIWILCLCSYCQHFRPVFFSKTSYPTIAFGRIYSLTVLDTHIIVEALLGSHLTLVVVLQVERHQVQHVPQRGGAGSLAEHLQARGETLPCCHDLSHVSHDIVIVMTCDVMSRLFHKVSIFRLISNGIKQRDVTS